MALSPYTKELKQAVTASEAQRTAFEAWVETAGNAAATHPNGTVHGSEPPIYPFASGSAKVVISIEIPRALRQDTTVFKTGLQEFLKGMMRESYGDAWLISSSPDGSTHITRFVEENTFVTGTVIFGKDGNLIEAALAFDGWTTTNRRRTHPPPSTDGDGILGIVFGLLTSVMVSIFFLLLNASLAFVGLLALVAGAIVWQLVTAFLAEAGVRDEISTRLRVNPLPLPLDSHNEWPPRARDLFDRLHAWLNEASALSSQATKLGP